MMHKTWMSSEETDTHAPTSVWSILRQQRIKKDSFSFKALCRMDGFRKIFGTLSHTNEVKA